MDSVEDDDVPIYKQLNKRRKFDDNDQFISADFVLGSVAEVDRIWSIEKYILSNARNRLNPHIFEALLSLKYNRHFWGDKLVALAISSPILEKRKTILVNLEKHVDFGFYKVICSFILINIR